ncbi:MAG: TIGR02391 family protein [Anaerolineales bacterium]|nr:TIGR02391 family protein [Anaerolineales bacterium]
MRGNVDDIQVLYSNPTAATFFLEKDSIGAFVNWLQADPSRALVLETHWQVVVFRHQILQYPDYRLRRARLTQLNIHIDNNRLHPQNGLFVDEVERTYFSNSGPNRHQLAEFYSLARQLSGNNWINIISQDRSFERIPMVNVYFIGTELRKGTQDLPAQFDFIHDFDIHPRLHGLANRLNNDSSYGDTVYNGIMALRDHVRQMSGLTTDGHDLMHLAFDDSNPLILMNSRTNMDSRSSQRNEQQGFHDIYCGLIKGLRNPLAHEGPDSLFAQARFPNKGKMLKYLSFLSLLCERADGPLP